jgi:hypothetical protein
MFLPIICFLAVCIFLGWGAGRVAKNLKVENPK